MKFSEYQEEARKTAIFPKGLSLIYPTMGLSGEAGECSEKVKKVLRDNDGVLTAETSEAIAYELGDVLWYMAAVADAVGYSLDEVAEMNLEKLASRRKRHKLSGSGDNR